MSAKSSRFIDAFSSREPVPTTSRENALAGDGGNRQRSFLRGGQPARLSRLLAAQPGIGQPLGGGLDRGQKAEQRQREAKQPEREIEGAGRKQQRTAAKRLQDSASLAALFFRK